MNNQEVYNQLVNDFNKETKNNNEKKLSRDELKKKLRQKINSKSYMRNSNHIKKNIKQDSKNIDSVAIQEALSKLQTNDPQMKKQLKKKINGLTKNDLVNNIENVKKELIDKLPEDEKKEYILKEFFKDGNPNLKNQQKLKKYLHDTILNYQNQYKNQNNEEDEFENLEEVNSDESGDEN